jgi:hypothetical protein
MDIIHIHKNLSTIHGYLSGCIHGSPYMLEGELVSSKPEGSAALKTETPMKPLVLVSSDVTPNHPAPDHLGENLIFLLKLPPTLKSV